MCLDQRQPHFVCVSSRYFYSVYLLKFCVWKSVLLNLPFSIRGALAILGSRQRGGMNAAEQQQKAALSNFRQYATVYNELTEVCFSSCVHELGARRLSEEEASCADTCAAKLLEATNRMVWKMAELNPLQPGGAAPPTR